MNRDRVVSSITSETILQRGIIFLESLDDTSPSIPLEIESDHVKDIEEFISSFSLMKEIIVHEFYNLRLESIWIIRPFRIQFGT